MEDLAGNVGETVDVVVGGVSAGVAVVVSKLDWWKRQSKGMRIATAVGAFLAVAIVLSLVTRIFT